MKREYDIAIVGGGMVGTALAGLLLRRIPAASLVLVDAEPPPSWRPDAEPGLRVSALSEASTRLLAVCGAWHAIVGSRACAYREMRVWDGASPPGGLGSLHFRAADVGAAQLGYIVENELVRHALREALAGAEPLTILDEARLTGLALDGPRAELALADGRRLRARLVVGADGGASTSRQLAGLQVRGRDYDQRAVVANLRCERHHAWTAWQRFLPDGPIALLPLADGEVSIVWSTASDRAEALLAMPDDAFRAAVTEASDGVLGEVLRSGRRASFPLRRRHAPVYTRARYALVGDAAHVVHPLAGQGVNLGLLDAAAMCEVLAQGFAAERDPGDPALLRRYERWRKSENLLAMAAFDGINRLFGNPNPALGALRRAGFTLVDRVAPLRVAFIRRAMGIAGDLPPIVTPAG